jgi:hypothetical protein
MAIYFMDGCEKGNNQLKINPSAGATYQIWSAGRWGNRVYGNNNMALDVPLAGGTTRICFAYGIYINSSGFASVFRIYSPNGQSFVVAQAGTSNLYVGKWQDDAQNWLNGTNGLWKTNQWNWVEVDIEIAGSTLNMKVWIDKQLHLSVSAPSASWVASGTPGAISTVRLGGQAYNYQDDIIVVDNNPGVLTFADFPLGLRRISVLNMNSDQAAGFTHISGANNYGMLTEETIDTTTYNYTTAAGTQDLFGTAGISGYSPASIQTAQVVIQGWNAGTSNLNIHPTVKSGATTVQGSDVTLNASPSLCIQQYNTDPNTGAAWTLSNLNAAQFGYQSA